MILSITHEKFSRIVDFSLLLVFNCLFSFVLTHFILLPGLLVGLSSLSLYSFALQFGNLLTLSPDFSDSFFILSVKLVAQGCLLSAPVDCLGKLLLGCEECKTFSDLFGKLSFFLFPINFNKIAMAARTQTHQEMADQSARAAELRRQSGANRFVESVPMEAITDSALNWPEAQVRQRDPHARNHLFSGRYPGSRSMHLQDLLARPNRGHDMDVLRSTWTTIGSIGSNQRSVLPVHITDVQALGNDIRVDDRLRARVNSRAAQYLEVGAINLEFLSNANPDGDQALGGILVDTAHSRVSNMVRGAFISRVAGQPLRVIYYPRTRVKLDGTENARFQLVTNFANNDIVQGYEIGTFNASAVTQAATSSTLTRPTSFLISQGAKTKVQAAKYANQLVATWHFEDGHDQPLPVMDFTLPSTFRQTTHGGTQHLLEEIRGETISFSHRFARSNSATNAIGRYSVDFGSTSTTRQSDTDKKKSVASPPPVRHSYPEGMGVESGEIGFLVGEGAFDEFAIYSGTCKIPTTLAKGNNVVNIRFSTIFSLPSVYTHRFRATSRATGGFTVRFTCHGPDLSGLGLVAFQHNRPLPKGADGCTSSCNTIAWNPCREGIVEMQVHPYPGLDVWDPSWLAYHQGGIMVNALGNWAEAPRSEITMVVEIFYREEMYCAVQTYQITRAIKMDCVNLLSTFEWPQDATFKTKVIDVFPTNVVRGQEKLGSSSVQHALLAMNKTIHADLVFEIVKTCKSLIGTTLCAHLTHDSRRTNEWERKSLLQLPYQLVNFDFSGVRATFRFDATKFSTWCDTEKNPDGVRDMGLKLILFSKDQISSTVEGRFSACVFLVAMENVRTFGISTGYADPAPVAAEAGTSGVAHTNYTAMVTQPKWPMLARNVWYNALKLKLDTGTIGFVWNFLEQDAATLEGTGEITYYAGPLVRAMQSAVLISGEIKIRVTQQGGDFSLMNYSNTTLVNVFSGDNGLYFLKKNMWKPSFEIEFEMPIYGNTGGAAHLPSPGDTNSISVSFSKAAQVVSLEVSFQVGENLEFYGA
jgi:hypothetical protein